jgi:hypothetical protein
MHRESVPGSAARSRCGNAGMAGRRGPRGPHGCGPPAPRDKPTRPWHPGLTRKRIGTFDSGWCTDRALASVAWRRRRCASGLPGGADARQLCARPIVGGVRQPWRRRRGCGRGGRRGRARRGPARPGFGIRALPVGRKERCPPFQPPRPIWTYQRETRGRCGHAGPARARHPSIRVSSLHPSQSRARGSPSHRAAPPRARPAPESGDPSKTRIDRTCAAPARVRAGLCPGFSAGSGPTWIGIGREGPGRTEPLRRSGAVRGADAARLCRRACRAGKRADPRGPPRGAA